MFQMGQQDGQLMAVFMKSVIAVVPEFDDGEARLRWEFGGNTSHGFVDDEICIAFG
jgi:hypothetical protein